MSNSGEPSVRNCPPPLSRLSAIIIVIMVINNCFIPSLLLHLFDKEQTSRQRQISSPLLARFAPALFLLLLLLFDKEQTGRQRQMSSPLLTRFVAACCSRRFYTFLLLLLLIFVFTVFSRCLLFTVAIYFDLVMSETISLTWVFRLFGVSRFFLAVFAPYSHV